MSTAIEAVDLYGFEVHPVADLFPLIEGERFSELVADIRENGLIEAVTVDMDGRLIDGRNRVRACHHAGVEVRTREYDGNDVTSFVVSLNMSRRHLTDPQRAMIAAEIASLPANRPLSPPYGGLTPTQGQVRDQMQVSSGSMVRARSIINHGIPELAVLAKSGAVPLETGSRVAQLPADEQHDFVNQVNAGVKPIEAAPLVKKPDVTKPSRPKSPPKYGTRRKHLQVIDAIVVGLGGYQIIAGEIKDSGLDSSVDKEQATRLADGLTEAIAALSAIRTLLKERTK